VSITRRFRRPARLCAITCALLMLPAALGAAVAAADPLAQERYYASYQPPDVSAQEQYYSSYGEPEPLPSNSSNDTPWMPIVLSIAGTLAVGAVSATQLRRVRVRRRRAAHTAA
jgi:hypothetical protein